MWLLSLPAINMSQCIQKDTYNDTRSVFVRVVSKLLYYSIRFIILLEDFDKHIALHVEPLHTHMQWSTGTVVSPLNTARYRKTELFVNF